jgi:DNA-binding winged helix-turn-helix (wHTH) protein/Tol biopolymer transport system component
MSAPRDSSAAGPVESASLASASRYSFGVFSVDLRTRKLKKGSTPVPIPARAFDTLVYLVANRRQVVDKNDIIAAAWRDVAVTDNSLTHAISVLRHALDDDPDNPTFIETVPRVGYRFVGEVNTPSPATPAVAATNERPTAMVSRSRWSPLAVGLLLLSIAATSWWIASAIYKSRPAEARDASGVVRLNQLAPPGTTILSGGVVSPSGNDLTFVARDDVTGQTALWVRSLRSSGLEKLAWTEGASKPFWSPDGRFIAFFANGRLSAVARSGDAARTIAITGSTPAGGSWGRDNIILFADWTSGLNALSAAGGPVRPITRVDHAMLDFAHAWPRFLPDGHHFLYQVVSLDPLRSGVYAGSIDSPSRVRVLDVISPAVYVPPGVLLYVRHDMLMAEGFDASRLTLDGRPVVLARGVAVSSWQDADVVSVSQDVLAFREGDSGQRLHVVDRAGMEKDSIDVSPGLTNLRLAPDQQRLVATSAPTEAGALWMIDLESRQHTRFASNAIGPVWAPDSDRVAFTANGGFDLYVTRRGAASSGPIVTDGFVKILNDWSPDGRAIVYSQLDPATKLDLWELPAAGGPRRPLLKTRFNESQARISPDGRWIAYLSDESGEPEIYVRRYPDMTQPTQVSVGGGAQAQWRHDQSELFYLSADNTLMAVPVHASGDISFGSPRRLFRTSVGFSPSDIRDSYVVMADGESFLLQASPDVTRPPHISVVINWMARLGLGASRAAAEP